jgi:hypothetical protein
MHSPSRPKDCSSIISPPVQTWCLQCLPCLDPSHADSIWLHLTSLSLTVTPRCCCFCCIVPHVAGCAAGYGSYAVPSIPGFPAYPPSCPTLIATSRNSKAAAVAAAATNAANLKHLTMAKASKVVGRGNSITPAASRVTPTVRTPKQQQRTFSMHPRRMVTPMTYYRNRPNYCWWGYHPTPVCQVPPDAGYGYCKCSACPAGYTSAGGSSLATSVCVSKSAPTTVR